MSFKFPKVQPDFAPLKITLANSGYQTKSNALYQTIFQTIDKTIQFQGITVDELDIRIIGPDIATNNAIARFDGTTGKKLKDSALLISDTGLLQFGGTTSAYPALKRNGTTLEVRLADDSAFAPISAFSGTFSSLTPTRVPFASTAGLLVDDADLTFVTDTLTSTKIIAPTSVTSPLVIGGTAVGSSLSLQSTSGVGTTDFIRFLVGNNGATEAMRIIDSGYVGIGLTPIDRLDVVGAIHTSGAAAAIRANEVILDFATGGRILAIGADASTNGLFRINTARSDNSNPQQPFTILASGFIGINSATPLSRLYIDGVGDIPLMALTVGGEVARFIANNASSGFRVGTVSADGVCYLAFNTGATASGSSSGNQRAYVAYFGDTAGYCTLGTNSGTALAWKTSGATEGNVGIQGVTAPTAKLHIGAGTATASTAPIKLTAGPVLTTPEPGTLEYDGTNFFLTP